MSYGLHSCPASVTRTRGEASLRSRARRACTQRETASLRGAANVPSLRALFFNDTQKEFPHHLPASSCTWIQSKNIYRACETPGHLGIKPGNRIQRESVAVCEGSHVWSAALHLGKPSRRRSKGRGRSPGKPHAAFAAPRPLLTRAHWTCRDCRNVAQGASEGGAGSMAGPAEGCAPHVSGWKGAGAWPIPGHPGPGPGQKACSVTPS